MNKYFPIFLDLEGKNVLVVGSGPVARQKIQSLSGTGARVKNVKYGKRSFRPQDFKGQDLVFCTTDDEALNRRVGKFCRARGILVNVADRPLLCSFILPALVRRGDVIFAISTGGGSPALAKFLRQRLEKLFGSEVAGLLRILKRARKQLVRLPLDQRRSALSKVISGETLSQIKKGQARDVRKKLAGFLKGE